MLIYANKPSPTQWDIILAPAEHWTKVYPRVAAHVRSMLRANSEISFTTAELAEALYPAELVRGLGKARTRLFTALAAVAKHDNQGFAVRDTPCINAYQRTVQRWLWQCPAGDIPPAANDAELSIDARLSAVEARIATLAEAVETIRVHLVI